MNKTPTTVVHNVTPKEKYTGTKLDLSHMKVFGCIAYVHVPDEMRTKLDPKAEKCVFIGYSLEQKGYRCYNPSTRDVRVSRDVVFDEMATWYSEVKDNNAADVNETVVTHTTGQQSQVLSGPQESPSVTSVQNPWSGRLRTQVSPPSTGNVSRKGKEKVGETPFMADVSSGSSHADMDSDGSEQSLDEEFGIPAVRTPSVRKAQEDARGQRSDPGPRRSGRVKNPIKRLTYDGYVAHHKAYMAKVI